MEYIYILLIIIFASYIQGMTSFGSSLVALPLLLIFLDIQVVVPMLAILNLFMNYTIYREVGKDADIKKIAPLLVTAVIFTVLGAIILKNLNEEPIRLVVGGIMLVTAISNLFGLRLQFGKPEKLFIPVGVLSGILNGATGMSGPPILLFLSNLDVSKKVFRSTLTSYFFYLNIVAIIMFIFNGLITTEVLIYAAIYLIPMLIGTQLGVIMSRKVHDEKFKKLVLVLMIFMSLNLILKSF